VKIAGDAGILRAARDVLDNLVVADLRSLELSQVLMQEANDLDWPQELLIVPLKKGKIYPDRLAFCSVSQK
jgi:hypothetical protein